MHWSLVIRLACVLIHRRDSHWRSYAISSVLTPDIAFFAPSVIAWLAVSRITCGTRARSASAVPTKAAKEIRRGEISEKGKGGGWWGASAYGGQAARLELAFCAKMGSSEVVKFYQHKIPPIWAVFYIGNLLSVEPFFCLGDRSIGEVVY